MTGLLQRWLHPHSSAPGYLFPCSIGSHVPSLLKEHCHLVLQTSRVQGMAISSPQHGAAGTKPISPAASPVLVAVLVPLPSHPDPLRKTGSNLVLSYGL